jgi:hypothetical protein
MSDSDIRKYLDAKAQMAHAEAKVERYRKRIIEAMNNMDRTEIKTDDYTARLRRSRMEHVYKRDVPADIWNRYKKATECVQLFVKESKKAIAKSP